MGDLILGLASRLDAFSAYPFPAWLPGDATGVTAGSPLAGPSRSSRTEDSSPILGLASRLDAFSAYPFPAWLPGDATGVTAGSPLAGPSRSSRTEDSSPQISFAHNRNGPN